MLVATASGEGKGEQQELKWRAQIELASRGCVGRLKVPPTNHLNLCLHWRHMFESSRKKKRKKKRFLFHTSRLMSVSNVVQNSQNKTFYFVVWILTAGRRKRGKTGDVRVLSFRRENFIPRKYRRTARRRFLSLLWRNLFDPKHIAPLAPIRNDQSFCPRPSVSFVRWNMRMQQNPLDWTWWFHCYITGDLDGLYNLSPIWFIPVF